MRVRVKFSKLGAMRFVGHLDIMRYFQKAMRRANIDIAYSEGFSPHQIMSFAAPLGLGLTSEGEYMDIDVLSTESSEESLAALQAVMVEGMAVTSYVALSEGAKKAMTAVAAADYIVYFKKEEDFSQEELAEKIALYLDRDAIEITKLGKVKRGKQSERVMDLKPLIYRFAPYCDGPETDIESLGIISELGMRKGFFLRLCTGSTDNVKPELVLSDFYAYFGRKYDPFRMQIHRLELFEQTDGRLRPLSEAGEVIP